MPVFPLLAAVLALVPEQPVAPPHLTAVQTPTPPLIDGRLDDAVWRAAPGSAAFTQSFPFDGGKPSERTVVRVLYDETALYIGFDCEQIHTPIVERLTRRDIDSESEWAYVQIDSRNDGQSAFMFAVNVAGVLADAQIIDQTTYSWEWDENWDAKTARTANGWSAEIRIPLRALRFDSKLPVQSWGLQATRFIAQRQETDIWAYVPRDVAAPIAFFGRLDDLRELKGAGALELQPFVLGFAPRRDTGQAALGCLSQACGSAGLDLKWHILQDLTFDAALNPDFAQVELDQVFLNLTTFETLLPEKRPFFLEGIDAFSFPMQVFYSRRIGSPPLAPSLRTDATGRNAEDLVHAPSPATIYGAGKLVGRLNADWTIAALSAVTGANRVAVVNDTTGAVSERLAAPPTAFNVLRVKRELGSGGHLGVIGTGSSAIESTGDYLVSGMPTEELCATSGQMQPAGTRCFRDAYLGGIDGLWRSPSGAYVLNGAFIESYSHGGPAFEQPDGTVISSGNNSPGGWLRTAKEGGHFLWSAEYTGAGRQLNYNDLGYMQRQNLHQLSASLGWRTLEPGKHTVDTTSAFVASDSRNLSWLDLGQTYQLNTRLHLLDFSSIFLAADYAPARFDDREVGNGTALERAGYLGGRLEYDSDPRSAVYATLANQTQIMGSGIYWTSLQASLKLHALPQLDIEFLPQLTWAAGEYRYAWQSDAATPTPADDYYGKLTAKSVSATLRASYTFTPRLTLQAYAQAFLASGHFDDVRGVMRPTTLHPVIHLSDIAAAPPVMAGSIANPDFEEASINANVVFRWEYRLGSTVYLVYTRSQFPPVTTFATPATLDPHAFAHGATSDVILLKVSYWWAS